MISLLRRCGIEVTTVGLYSADVILGSSKMHLKPEMSLAEAFPPNFDMDAIILTGGNSAVEFMRKEEAVSSKNLLRKFYPVDDGFFFSCVGF